MIRLKVRSHKHKVTEAREYGTHDHALLAIESAAVDRSDAIRIVHGEVFAYIGMHPATGQRFGIWRTTSKKAS